MINNTYAIILASGEGTRYGSRKQYDLLDGLPLYKHVLNATLEVVDPTKIVVVVNSDRVNELSEVITSDYGTMINVISGGTERYLSVKNGIDYIKDRLLTSDCELGTDKVVVLESARPYVTSSHITKLLDTISPNNLSVTYGLPINDAVLYLNYDQEYEYPNRSNLVSIQTPQAFDLATLIDAQQGIENQVINYYEECHLILTKLQLEPTVLEGNSSLLKITRINDMDSLRNMKESKVVLVTGGNGSLGSKLVEYFNSKNYKVLSPSRSELNLESNESVRDYLESLTDKVDILVNNAGIMMMNKVVDSQFFINSYNMVNINLMNPLLLTSELIKRNPKMTTINISSTSGELGRPEFMGYGISKSGMMIMTESLVAEGHSSYCINPGRLDSKLRSNLFGNEDKSSLLQPSHVVLTVDNILSGMYNNGSIISIRLDDNVFKQKLLTR
jgi:2-C-methyl-D-erythritol 4-phosphate cytidylyltransferase